MKTSRVSVALSGAALAVVLGGSAGAKAETSPPSGQARIAETTQKLESAFSEQFVKGQIDRAALAPLAADVVRAMPEAARPQVQAHIDLVLQGGEKLASQLSQAERAQAAAAPAAEKVGPVQVGIVTAWGWPGYAGFGGMGAFGFPGMYYGAGMGCGFTGAACGLGLGTMGWYW
jgi:hypothetical protein